MSGEKCPTCHIYRPDAKTNRLVGGGRDALSRRDNETDICSECGTVEALDDLMSAGRARRYLFRNRDGQYLIKNTPDGGGVPGEELVAGPFGNVRTAVLWAKMLESRDALALRAQEAQDAQGDN